MPASQPSKDIMLPTKEAPGSDKTPLTISFAPRSLVFHHGEFNSTQLNPTQFQFKPDQVKPLLDKHPANQAKECHQVNLQSINSIHKRR
jgi:hypothetical protein